MGYMVASIRGVGETRVGDTILDANDPASEMLPGYRDIHPMVFAGLYPTETNQFEELRDALARLQLNDAALHYVPETSVALGFGFRCGFLGLLHMDIVRERLEREFNLDLIATVPNVEYHVHSTDGSMELIENPKAHRADPYRIPISRIQDARVLRAGENPARIEHYTQGWLGNTMWKDVVHFKYPVADYEARLRDYAYGRGFFLHNFAYESAGKGLRVAPVFVLQELVRFVPEPDPFFAYLGYVVAGAAVLLAGLFFLLLARDKRRAQALRQEMARRKQARRSRQESIGTASP